MAISIALRRGAISDDLTYFMVEDNTGTYDATSNPGGYGAPNPERSELALFIYGYKYHKETADSALEIVNNLDPENAASWQVMMSEDGYHYIRVVAVPLWNGTTEYILGELKFYATKFYKATQTSTNLDPVNNPDYWTEVTDLTTDEVYENTSVYVHQFDTVIDSRGKKCYQLNLSKKAKDNCNCSGEMPGAVVQPYMRIFVHLNTAKFNCLQQKYALADDQLKYLSEYCDSIGCGC